MKFLFFICIAVSFITLVYAATDNSDATMLNLYNEINAGLINLKKNDLTIQLKVSWILDQVNKLFLASKDIAEKMIGTKKLLQIKIAENDDLKKEIIVLKNDTLTKKQSLDLMQEELYKKLENEQLQIEKLTKERNELLAKIAKFENEKEQSKKNITAQSTSFEKKGSNKFSITS